MKRLAVLPAVLTALVFAFVPVVHGAEGPQTTTEEISQLDINSANAESIANALDGIGLVKAREIVAYREMFGSFQSIEELADVRGVGMATVDKNRHKIVILAQ